MIWIFVVSSVMTTLWQLSAIVMHIAPIRRFLPGFIRKALRFAFWELRPLFVPAAVIHIGLGIILAMVGTTDLFTFGLQLFNWWWLKDPKDDDDDRWKRRVKKAAEKVSVLGGRLVVARAEVA